MIFVLETYMIYAMLVFHFKSNFSKVVLLAFFYMSK